MGDNITMANIATVSFDPEQGRPRAERVVRQRNARTDARAEDQGPQQGVPGRPGGRGRVFQEDEGIPGQEHRRDQPRDQDRAVGQGQAGRQGRRGPGGVDEVARRPERRARSQGVGRPQGAADRAEGGRPEPAGSDDQPVRDRDRGDEGSHRAPPTSGRRTASPTKKTLVLTLQRVVAKDTAGKDQAQASG